MPYKLRGNCVVNSDTGEEVKGGCHSTHEQALAHMKALYANVPDASKEVAPTPSPYNAHGPGGIMAQPGQGGRKRKRGVTNSMISPKEFAQHFSLAEKDFAYAASETWVMGSATVALSALLDVARQEAQMQEPGDTKEILNMIKDLSSFISDQADEAIDAADNNEGSQAYKEETENTEETEKSLGGFLVTDADGNKHLPTRVNGKLDKRHLGAAKAALTVGYRGNKYSGPDKSSALAKLRRLYSEAGLEWDEKEVQNNSSFYTEKDADGHYRWVLRTGSAFRDRDNEIISTKAWNRDCDEMEVTGDYGELLWWHCDGEVHAGEKEARPYLPLGKCDTSFMYNMINIESGIYYDDAIGKEMSKRADELGASKAFYHTASEPDADGVYSYIRTKERSIMPRGKESNLLTRLLKFGSKEQKMATNAERLAALKEMVGSDSLDKELARAKKDSEKAAQMLSYKEAREKDKVMDAGEAEDEGGPLSGDGDQALKKKPIKKNATPKEAKKKPSMDEAADDEDEDDNGKEYDESDVILTTKELRQALVETMKEVNSNIATLTEIAEKQQAQLNRFGARQARLMGDMPRRQEKGYRASEDDESVVDESSGDLMQSVQRKYKEQNGESDQMFGGILSEVLDMVMKPSAQ